MDIEIIKELNKFSHIEYHDIPHCYYCKGKELVSATRFVSKYKAEFKTQEVAVKFAQDNDREVEGVLDEWDYKRDYSTIKGNLIHRYAENYYANKVLPYPSEEMIRIFGYDIMKTVFEQLVGYFHNFYQDSKKNLIPIKSEWILGDEELGISGCLDQLFYNQKSGELEIYDYKSNKKIDFSDKYLKRFKHPIEHLEMCEFNTYSLQLSLYKFLVEKNTNLKIGNCYLVWIMEKNDNYKIFKCDDRSEEIEAMIRYGKKHQWI